MASPMNAFAALMILSAALPAAAQGAGERAPIEAPRRPADEAAYVKKMDAALAPVRAIALSDADTAAVRKAITALSRNLMTRFSEIYDSVSNPTARKFLLWARLRGGYGSASEYVTFLDENPLWAERSLLVRRKEESLFTNGGTADDIKAAFAHQKPETGIGHAALASAYLVEGNSEEAARLARIAWREMAIPATLETGFLKRFGALLKEADHKWRFDRLVTDDIRFSANRAERAAFAERIIPLLSEAERQKARARLALFNREKGASERIVNMPFDDTDFGLAYHRAQALRKLGRTKAAADIILSVPTDRERIAEIDEWWAERRQLAFSFLKADQPRMAYSIVRDAGPLSVNPQKDQAFMAGWIAWRYLGDAAAAEPHFRKFADAADGPLSRAKSRYWLGRLLQERGQESAALDQYRKAAENNDTFHGLLSMQMIDPQRTELRITPPAFPTQQQIDAFNTSDAVQAVVIARKAGLSRDYTRGFLTSLRIGLNSEAEAAMIAHLAEAIGDPQMSVRIAKAAVARGDNLLTYAYPVHHFPRFTPLSDPPEQAFLLGITRQETEFEPKTLSSAGAKGFMQVMTVTAKHVCRDYKFKCEISRLMDDKPYNVRIAAAYIGDRMREFGNSYILGLAGYNAGPGRARQWVRENGDPRSASVDPIDWIERIPFTETREYVAKVLSNIQVYRARLGDGQNALRLSRDLKLAQGTRNLPKRTLRSETGTASTREE